MSIQNRVVKVNHIRDFEGGIMKDNLILRSIMMKIRNMLRFIPRLFLMVSGLGILLSCNGCGIKYGLRIFKPVLLPLIMP